MNQINPLSDSFTQRACAAGQQHAVQGLVTKKEIHQTASFVSIEDTVELLDENEKGNLASIAVQQTKDEKDIKKQSYAYILKEWIKNTFGKNAMEDYNALIEYIKAFYGELSTNNLKIFESLKKLHPVYTGGVNLKHAGHHGFIGIDDIETNSKYRILHSDT